MGFLKKFLPSRPLTSSSFFFLKKVANIEAKRAIIAVLFYSVLPPLSFYFSFPCLLQAWLSSLSGAKNLPFDPFSLKLQQIYTNPEDWHFYWATEYLILHTLRAFRAKLRLGHGLGRELDWPKNGGRSWWRSADLAELWVIFFSLLQTSWFGQTKAFVSFCFSPLYCQSLLQSRETREKLEIHEMNKMAAW